MKLVPVILTVYNRPIHINKTLTALELNDYSSETDIIIYSDGGKSDKDKKLVDLVRLECSKERVFKSITVINRVTNLGLANNVIQGVSEQIKIHGKVIVLEDDLITSPGFLTYMNKALDFYENSNVFSITGFSRKVKMPKDYPYSTYLSRRVSSLGWGIWENKWNKVDWSVNDFDLFIKNKSLINRFNLGGNDLTMMLTKQHYNKINSWAVRFAFHCSMRDYRCVFPIYSLINHIGFTGTNSKLWSRRIKVEIIDYLDYNFCKEDNIEILNRLQKLHNVSLIRKFINFYMFKFHY